MITSIFLARFFGLIMIIVTLALLFGKKNFDLVLRFYQNKMAILAKGLINVILGIWLILYHNLWTTGLDIATTLFCWAILIVGLINLFFPGDMTKMLGRLRKDQTLGTAFLLVFLLLGIYFTCSGFIY